MEEVCNRVMNKVNTDTIEEATYKKSLVLALATGGLRSGYTTRENSNRIIEVVNHLMEEIYGLRG